MALLSTDKRKAYFKELGLGTYNKDNILKFQKKAFTKKSEWDGVYGTNTDNALRTYYNVKKYTTNFTPAEFRCDCGDRYCSGYPTYMRPEVLKNIQAIRNHWNVPITVTCGMRCKGYNNSLQGSIYNSKHLTGQAIDFYQKGVTDTLANRKAAIKWIKTLPNHNYTYGDGYNSSGYAVSAPYMGNALHTDITVPAKKTTTTTTTTTTTKAAITTTAAAAKATTTTTAKVVPVTVDGKFGPASIKGLQHVLKVKETGKIKKQSTATKKYHTAFTGGISYEGGGSPTIKALQKKIGYSKQDGYLGPKTIKTLQKFLNVKQTSYFDATTAKALQKWINTGKVEKPAATTTTTTKTTTTTTTAKTTGAKIASTALSYCGNGKSATSKYKSAAKSVYGNGNDTNCHRFVGVVLRKCGMPKMDISGKTAVAWQKILKYLKANCKEIKVNYTESQLKPGDIRVWWKGGNHYHIYIVTGKGKKAEAAHNKKYPKKCNHNAKTKHKKDWLFRVK